jgi:hypothetical protein
MGRSPSQTLADRIEQADDPERARVLATLWTVYRTHVVSTRIFEFVWRLLRAWYQHLACLTAALIEATVELFLDRL